MIRYRSQAAVMAASMLTLAVSTVTTVSAASASAREREAAARARCLDTVRTSVPQVMLTLVDRVGLPRDARDQMQIEAILPWRALGVTVKWSNELHPTAVSAASASASVSEFASASATTGPALARIYVIITPGESGTADREELARVRPLASILFVDRKPTTLINVYPREVLRLLSASRLDDKGLADHPRALQERLIGRVLGRAVAHEIGHFLFASRDHASSGLMRATHRMDHLLAPAPHEFTLIVPPPLACLDSTRTSQPDVEHRREAEDDGGVEQDLQLEVQRVRGAGRWDEQQRERHDGRDQAAARREPEARASARNQADARWR